MLRFLAMESSMLKECCIKVTPACACAGRRTRTHRGRGLSRPVCACLVYDDMENPGALALFDADFAALDRCCQWILGRNRAGAQIFVACELHGARPFGIVAVRWYACAAATEGGCAGGCHSCRCHRDQNA